MTRKLLYLTLIAFGLGWFWTFCVRLGRYARQQVDATMLVAQAYPEDPKYKGFDFHGDSWSPNWGNVNHDYHGSSVAFVDRDKTFETWDAFHKRPPAKKPVVATAADFQRVFGPRQGKRP